MPRLKYNDRFHSYWIDGTRATGVSGVAKGFQDSYNIDRKIKRDVAKGMARRPDLCTMVAALGDEDSWETKKKIDKIATDAIEASGAWAKANHGTAKHTILERVHKGLPLDDVFDDRLLDYAEAYRELIDGSGLTPVGDLTERFVVYPEQLIAGRLDCAYFALDKRPALLLGDFKSGTRAVQYPHSIVAQLGLYLNAPFLYNEATDEFDPAPLWGDTIIIAHVPDELDQFGLWTIDASLARTVALQALERHRYIQAGADTLVKQWIVPVRCAESESVARDDPLDVSSAPVTEPGEKASLGGGSSLGALDRHQPADPFDGLVDGRTDPPAKPERRAWIIRRLKILKEAGAMGSVALRWPEGLAYLKNNDRHTDRDLDRIVAVLDAVEAEFTVTFGDKDPTKEETPGRWTTRSNTTCNDSTSDPSSASETTPTPTTTHSSTDSTASNKPSTKSSSPSPSTPDEWTTTSGSGSSPTSPEPANTSPSTSPETTAKSPSPPSEQKNNSNASSSSSVPDEGPAADPDAVATLQHKYQNLPDEARAWIAGIARDANKAGRPIHLAGTPTIRRFEIVRGLVVLAAAGFDEDEIVRRLIAVVRP